MHQLGYCCINQTLSDIGITTGRTMRKATFVADTNLVLTSKLALQNAHDLVKIIRWNIDNNVWVFRMGSNVFPWNSEYALSDLPDFEDIEMALQQAGTLAKQNAVRITAHPDHFVKLASEKPHVVSNSIRDLHHHDEVFNLMGFPACPTYCLNIHVGQNRTSDTSERFVRALDMLNTSTRNRLVVENDDKDSGYSVRDLYRILPLDVPITFDYFHHTFHTGNMPARDAAWIAASTWDTYRPLFHYSESKNINEGVSGNPRAHADYVYTPIDTFDIPMDIDLEAKKKELALLLLRTIQLDVVSIPNHEFKHAK